MRRGWLCGLEEGRGGGGTSECRGGVPAAARLLLGGGWGTVAVRRVWWDEW